MIDKEKVRARLVVEMLNSINAKELNKLTPDGLYVSLRTHDTATHCYISHKPSDDVEPLLVWYKTNWVSHNYEFNERGKTIGLQPGCEFIKDYLDEFFDRCQRYLNDKKQRDQEAKCLEKEAQEKKRQQMIEEHKRIFNQKQREF